MSGICALFSLDQHPISADWLQQMTMALHYRGPEDQQIWVSDHVGLGHAAFGVDPNAAHQSQPLDLKDLGVISLDARLDGRQDLIKRLRDHRLGSQEKATDAELILSAYQVWGERCTDHLLGDFAFILWDPHKQRLFCARDPLGLRVLYYSQLGSTLILSSQIPGLLAYPGVDQTLNEQAIGDFLLFGTHEWLDHSATIYRSIFKLPPAHQLIADRSGVQVRRYWDLPLDQPLLCYHHASDYEDHFRQVFRQAVRDRLRSDQIVIALSGGLDSGTVAATACDLIQSEALPVQITAITHVYDRIHPSQERYYAGLTAEKLGLPHRIFAWDDQQLSWEGLLAKENPEPVMGFFSELGRQISIETAELGRVLLIGRSGDNLLALSPLGSMLWEMPWQALRWGWDYRRQTGQIPPFTWAHLQRRLKATQSGEPMRLPLWLRSEFVKRLQLRDRWQLMLDWLPDPIHPRHPLSHRQLLLPNWIRVNSHLPRIGLQEIADPFLDRRVVDFVHRLPPLPWMFRKQILRRSMLGFLPDPVLNRPKTPIGYLIDSLLAQPNMEWVDQWQAHPLLLEYVDRDRIPDLVNTPIKGKRMHLMPLFLNAWFSRQS